MAPPCDICPKAVSFDEDYEPDFIDQSDWFHASCTKCDSAQYLDPDVCSWCKHIRLRHLVKCVQVHDIWPRPHFYMRQGLLTDGRAEACPLCRIFKYILMSMSHRVSLEVLANCCLEFSIDQKEDSVIGWFSSNKFDELVGPMFHVQDSGNDKIFPLITERISWQSLKDGIDYCVKHHRACRNDNLSLPPGFRVIDVEEQRIVKIQSKQCNFFALSYVWGKDDSHDTKTTKEKLQAFQTPGALSRINLPRTVKDAIIVCQELGQRFLWVDRLCIVQDDPADKANQILAMDKIYLSAQHVIIADGSEDMHSGLCGVSRARTQTQMRIQVGGMTMTSEGFDSFCDSAYKGSVWQERGWTYQELELARRKIYFRNTMAFLECRYGRKWEYTRSYDELDGSAPQTTRRTHSLFHQFIAYIDAYSRRKLSFYSDSINAITGVITWLYGGTRNEFLWGLPSIHFDRAVLWYGTSMKTGTAPNRTFPSWSWACILEFCPKIAFRNTLYYGAYGLRSYEFCGTIVPWYTYGPEAGDPLRPINAAFDGQPIQRWRTYVAQACRNGCVLSVDTTHDQALEELWPTYESYSTKVATTVPALPKSSPSLLNLRNLMTGQTLLTIGQTASLSWRTRLLDNGLIGVDLLSPRGEPIGEVQEYLEDQSQYEHLCSRWPGRLEVLGISIMVLTAPGEEGWTAAKGVEVDGQAFPDIPFVNVLVIGRRAELAYRVQLGWVCLADWIALERKWECIVLE